MLIHLLLGMLATPASGAQGSCDLLLGDGLRDLRDYAATDHATVAFSQWFCDEEARSSGATRSAGGGLVFKALSAEFQQKSEDWSTFVRRLCKDERYNSETRSQIKDVVSKLNVDLADRFNACLQTKGLHVWLERTERPDEAIFAATYNSPGYPPTTSITGFSPSPNLDCSPLPKPEDEIGGSTLRIRCSRRDDDAASIVVNAKSDPIGGGRLSIPGVSRFPVLLTTRRRCTIEKDAAVASGCRSLCRDGEFRFGLRDAPSGAHARLLIEARGRGDGSPKRPMDVSLDRELRLGTDFGLIDAAALVLEVAGIRQDLQEWPAPNPALCIDHELWVIDPVIEVRRSGPSR